MLLSMTKPEILSGGNQTWQKSPITNQYQGDLGSLQKPSFRPTVRKKKLFVVDCYCGANENSRLKVRFIVEVAWQAHFVKNMFIRPEEEELNNFKPDFVVLNASKATNPDWKKQGLNSENFIFFNLTEGMSVIGGTWYGGEMKKGIFSVMNYYLPLKGTASMHCSANVGKDGRYCYILRTLGNRKNNPVH